MVYLEYKRIESKRYYAIVKNVHHCNKCSYFSRSMFLMLNHVQRHKREEKTFTCSEEGVEAYLCTQCQFRTFLTVRFIQHVKQYHSHTGQANPYPALCYKCKDCTFETCSVAFWLKHRDLCPIKNKKRLKKLDTIFKSRQEEVVKVEASNLGKRTYRCSYCPLLSKYPQVVAAHNKQHVSKSLWLECENCGDYKTRNTMNFIKHCHRFHNRDKGERRRIRAGKTHLKRGKVSRKPNLKPAKNPKSKNFVKNVFSRSRKCGVFMNGKFWCNFCSFKSKYAQVVKVHSQLHTSKSKILKCEDCNRTATTTYQFLKHYSRYHKDKHNPEMNLSIKPEQPDEKEAKIPEISQNETVIKQEKIKIQAEIKPKLQKKPTLETKSKPKLQKKPTPKAKMQWFKCDSCSFRTLYQGVIQIHYIKHMLPQPQWFQCDRCYYKTDHIDHLVKHCRIHFRHMKKAFKTMQPNMKIAKKQKLQQLKASATKCSNRKWRNCDQCDYGTKILANLRRHILTVHTSDDDKSVEWFKCDQCDYKAKLKCYLKKHLILKHG